MDSALCQVPSTGLQLAGRHPEETRWDADQKEALASVGLSAGSRHASHGLQRWAPRPPLVSPGVLSPLVLAAAPGGSETTGGSLGGSGSTQANRAPCCSRHQPALGLQAGCAEGVPTRPPSLQTKQTFLNFPQPPASVARLHTFVDCTESGAGGLPPRPAWTPEHPSRSVMKGGVPSCDHQKLGPGCKPHKQSHALLQQFRF